MTSRDYTTRDLFTVEELTFSDGITRYNLNGIDENGNTWSGGVYNDIDLVIEVLKKIGKLEEKAKVFISN